MIKEARGKQENHVARGKDVDQIQHNVYLAALHISFSRSDP